VEPDGLRLIELMAALSLATDLGTGQPMEHALRTSVLALRAAEAMGLPSSERPVILYTTLLRFLGCTSDASVTAALVGGDEIAFNAAMAPMVMADDRQAVPYLVRHLGEDLSFPRRLGRVAAALSDPGGKSRSLSGHCEVGARLATRIGLPLEVTAALAHAYERWDGKGVPQGLAGDDVPLAIRVAVVARDVDVWWARSGAEETLAMLARRRGRAYDPAVVDAFTTEGRSWIADLEGVDVWQTVLDADRGAPVLAGGERVDAVLLAFADFADLKSPWFRGHSRGVSDLAAAAAAVCGLEGAEVVRVRRAALVHDLGVVGVPCGVWDRPGPISSEGWERVRLHPYLSERILGRCNGLAGLASDASAHHERADGSGYPHGGRDLSLTAQIVAAADVYRAVGEDRPHRPRLAPGQAATVLAQQADAGFLVRGATDAVLAAAGHSPALPNVERPAGMTEREVDVLRLIARGKTNKEVARELGISPKTVGAHIEHIYTKAEVATRAGVTLFAMEHHLLQP
jgi:HD-GYP domain-containing protein (c-di-GMP phosphodiesterase class II)